jgi:hypothetical protein
VYHDLRFIPTVEWIVRVHKIEFRGLILSLGKVFNVVHELDCGNGNKARVGYFIRQTVTKKGPEVLAFIFRVASFLHIRMPRCTPSEAVTQFIFTLSNRPWTGDFRVLT